MNLIKSRLKEFFLLWKNYSFSYACYSILWWICFYIRPPYCNRISTFAIRKKTEWLDRYFNENYQDIINKYQGKNWNTESIGQAHIWVFWGQGEEKMPPLVKACYRQLTYYNENVELITNDNISNYIKLPDIVLEKVNSGKLTWAYFSDIVRNTILSEYGGIWIDATVWVSGRIPMDTLTYYRFFSPAENTYTDNKSMRFWSNMNYNWNGWCMWSNCKKYITFSFVSEMLIEIAKRENVIPDYVTIDYLIYLAIRLFPKTHEDLERTKDFQCKNRHELANRMSTRFDMAEYKALIEENFIFKLSFRANWEERDCNGQQTFYGRILEDVI